MHNITALQDFSSFSIMQVLTARQKKMDVLTTHRSDLGASQHFCEKLADNSSKCIDENIISILFQGLIEE
jgi:hypothetical protein